MSAPNPRPLLRLLDFAPVALFAVVLLVFGLMSDKFLTAANLTQVLIQASSTAVVGVGMTFVLLTAGVELFLTAADLVTSFLAALALEAGMRLLDLLLSCEA